MVKIVEILVFTALFLYLCGYGLTKLLLPEELKKYQFFYIPFIGLAFSISLLQYAGYFLPVKKSIWLLIGLSFSLGIFGFLKDRRIETNRGTPLNYVLPLSIFFLALIIGLFPLFKLGFPTSFGVTNNDAFWFILQAKWLQTHPFTHLPEVTSSFPLYNTVHYSLTHNIRLGIDLFHAALASITKLDPYQTFSILTAFLLSLFTIAIYLFCRSLLKLSLKASLLASLFVAINSGVFRLHFDSNLAQIAGSSFLLLSLGSFPLALKKKDWRYRFFSGLMISGLISVYLELSPFFILPIFIYTVYILLSRQINFSPLVKKITTITFIIIGINFNAFYRLVLSPSLLSQVRGEVVIPFLSWLQYAVNVFGLENFYSSLSLAEFSLRHQLFLVVWSLILIALVFYGLYKLSTENRILFLGVIITAGIFAFYLRYVQVFSYGFFKNLMFGQFVIPIALAIAFTSLWNKSKGFFLKLIFSGLLSFFLLLTGVAGLSLVKAAMNTPLAVTKQYILLQKINEKTKPGSTIFVAETVQPYTLIHFEHYAVYFLTEFAKRKVSFFSHEYSYLRGNHDSNYFYNDEYDYILTPFAPPTAEWHSYIWRSGNFFLYKRQNEQIIFKSKNWWEGEVWNGIPTRWMNNDAEMSVDGSLGGKVKLSLKAVSAPPFKKRTLDIYVNNILVETFLVGQDTNEILTKPFTLKPGENIVKFHSREPAKRSGGQDSRELSIAFQKMRIIR